MPFRMNGPPMPSIPGPAPCALPGIFAERLDFILQGMADRDSERVPIDPHHHVVEILPMIRAAFPDIELPLVDHLMGQGANQL